MALLDGKLAFVTGGSRGIGAEIARRFAKEGAHVAFTYARSASHAVQVAEDIKAAGRSALALEADNADVASVSAAVKRAIAELGAIDILVNNAGLFRPGAFDSLAVADFDAAIATNVRGAFVTSREVASQMRSGGRIINIGSNLAERVPGPGLTLYATSKAALIGMTKGMARDLGPRGITVNIIHPGSTDTDMNPSRGATADLQRSLMAIPRFAEPREIASFVAWLASSESQFVTGAALTMDGGANA
jgi:3-oxoacyl-[acyl-carrier protein] reductase